MSDAESPFWKEALSRPVRAGRRADASSVAPVYASAFGYHRDAASFHRTPHHDPGEESSFQNEL